MSDIKPRRHLCKVSGVLGRNAICGKVSVSNPKTCGSSKHCVYKEIRCTKEGAADMFNRGAKLTPEQLRRNFKLSMAQSRTIIEKLIEEGVVSPDTDRYGRYSGVK